MPGPPCHSRRRCKRTKRVQGVRLTVAFESYQPGRLRSNIAGKAQEFQLDKASLLAMSASMSNQGLSLQSLIHIQSSNKAWSAAHIRCQADQAIMQQCDKRSSLHPTMLEALCQGGNYSSIQPIRPVEYNVTGWRIHPPQGWGHTFIASLV